MTQGVAALNLTNEAGAASAPARPAPKTVYHTLDGARGVAALCVVVYHAAQFIGPTGLPSGYLGVDLFFVLSGFVLAHAYEPRFAAGLGTAGFMGIRVARLYPLYLLGALIGLASAVIAWKMGAGSVGGLELFWDAVTALFMAPAVFHPSNPNLYPLNGPAWSLFFELAVNLIYVGLWRRLTTTVLAAIVGVSAVLLGVAAYIHGSLQVGGLWSDIGFGAPRICFSFFAGVLIFRRLRRPQRFGRWAWLLPLVLVPIFALDPQPQWRPLTDLACVILVIPALVVVMSWYSQGPRASRIYGFLAATSFAVYALHFPLLELSRRALKVAGVQAALLPGPWVLVFLAGLLAGCWLVDVVYDQPVRKRLASWLSANLGRRPRAVADSSAA